jgi:hypothetical protein
MRYGREGIPSAAPDLIALIAEMGLAAISSEPRGE